VLFQQLFGLKEAELFFDVCVHLGTLVAVIVVFHREIQHIIAALLRLVSVARQNGKVLQQIESDPDLKMALLIVIGSIPTAVLGLMFHSIADTLFSSSFFTGLMLMVTGSILWLTRRAKPSNKGTGIEGFSGKKAFIIGIVQGLAIIPGISRSGSTISIGLLLGIDRETAARYSFLLSIPAIVGAGALSLKDGLSQTDPVIRLSLLGAAAAAIVGYGALKVLLSIVKKGHLYVFAPYCWLAGILAIVLSW
jgi:undecaprenyl-diphosphatase